MATAPGITPLGAAGSATMQATQLSAHKHITNVGASGTVATNMNNYTITNVNSVTSAGNMRFTPEGDILAFDGTNWVQIAGLSESKEDKIKKELIANWPDAAFDLMLKGLL